MTDAKSFTSSFVKIFKYLLIFLNIQDYAYSKFKIFTRLKL